MRQLPTGTVTFLFSDIEGSTRLLRELGDEYATVRSEHSEIIRVAIARHDGVEIGTEGDSFFVTFRTARDAVLAAIDAQRGLAEHRWRPGSPVRVRMGIHTGEGRLSGNDYVGMDVHRAARIAAAAHGGQVIISAATEALVEHQLPDGVRVRDLGEHRLKDIVNPERLYDLVIGGLAADFPPPRSLEARPNNLPLQLTSFVGREDQLTEIKQLLQNARLVTLTGAGGTGKTRLALQAAADTLSDYRDGTFFVDLSAVVDPALVPAAIAQAIGIAEIPGKPILEALKGDLRTKQILLVLDNFEQVVDAAAAVEELLTGCPDVKALITSRVVLTLRGEHEYPVPPLVPPDLNRLPEVEKLGQIEAVRLFAERAQAVEPRFRLTQENAVAVAELTVRLDALPLAIELAASRSKVLSPEQMLPLLAQSLSLLSSRSRSLPERQRTLRGAIGWSYDLLAESEQRVFAQLAVFSGGWTLQAAQAVTNAGSALEVLEHLTSLADKSLVRVAHSNGDSRFSMLETIREFGWDRLQADGSLDETRRRHGTYFVEKALEAEPHLTGPAQATWLDYCDRERDNLRTALRWTIDTREAEIAQSAAAALWRYWQQRGHLNEGKRWLDEVLTMPGGDQPTRARAKALTGAGGIAWWRIDHPAARQFYG